MALQLKKEVRDTGLELDYHKIEAISGETISGFITIKIGLYKDKAASQAGKRSVFEYHIDIPFEKFICSGSLVASAYTTLKSEPQFEGSVDV